MREREREREREGAFLLSFPGRFIPKNKKMVLDASLLNTQHYKVWIKGKVEQSREGSSTLLYTSVLLATRRIPFQ